MPKHNNAIPRNHFHKKWQESVRTWFDQPGRKLRRRLTRAKKASKVAPRPTELLRPAVRCPTIRYNMKLRSGRGFTLGELKAAGIRTKEALTIGIPVDHRRRDRNEESMRRNIERLRLYQGKLVVFPLKKGKAKKGDSSASDLAQVTQVTGAVLPLKQTIVREKSRAITKDEQSQNTFYKLRQLRADARTYGKRMKAAAEEKAKL